MARLDSNELDAKLVRLMLDGKDSRLVAGMRGFPLLKVDGQTVYGCSKTVLVKNRLGKYTPAPGVRYVVANEGGQAAGEFGGRRHYAGPVDVPLDLFMERFGAFFERNEIGIEEPADPFASYFSPA